MASSDLASLHAHRCHRLARFWQAVCITILVGFSVDYTVHIAVAYVDHRGAASDRAARTLRAISTLGISVTAGAASTAGACLFLFPATILFLPKFGQFMVSAVATAFLFAMVAFSALLATFGPVDAQGHLSCLDWLGMIAHPVHGADGGDGGDGGRTSAESGAESGAETGAELGAVASSTRTNSAVGAGGDDVAFGLEGGGGGVGGGGGGGVESNNEYESYHGVVEATSEKTELASIHLPSASSAPGAASRPPSRCLISFLLLAVALLCGAVALQYIPDAIATSGCATDPASLTKYHMPPLASMKPGRWEEMRPGGATMCSRGTPFAFYVRRGRTDRVILEFMGGGACWSLKTCGLQKSTFRETIDDLRPLFSAGYSDDDAGGGETPPPPPPPQPVGTGDYIRNAGLSDLASTYIDWTHGAHRARRGLNPGTTTRSLSLPCRSPLL